MIIKITGKRLDTYPFRVDTISSQETRPHNIISQHESHLVHMFREKKAKLEFMEPQDLMGNL